MTLCLRAWVKYSEKKKKRQLISLKFVDLQVVSWSAGCVHGMIRKTSPAKLAQKCAKIWVCHDQMAETTPTTLCLSVPTKIR